MKTPRDPDPIPTSIGPKVDPKKPAAASPHDNWKRLPAHPGWEQNPVTRAVKRSGQ